MTEKKVVICCGTSEDLCKDLTCKFEETDKGFQISVTSDDPEKVKKLKEKFSSCCNSGSDKSCC